MKDKLCLAVLWLWAAVIFVYIALVTSSFVDEYVLSNFFYWGYPQWGWIYSTPKIYLMFNIPYILGLVLLLVLGLRALLRAKYIGALICLGIPMIAIAIAVYTPTYNWNREFKSFSSSIPAGKWWISPQLVEKYDDQTSWEKLKGYVSRGRWPGGYAFWGPYRIWLRPDFLTFVQGRRGMVIHGGTRRASPWGIDMGNDIVDFATMLRESQKPLELNVE